MSLLYTEQISNLILSLLFTTISSLFNFKLRYLILIFDHIPLRSNNKIKLRERERKKKHKKNLTINEM